MRSVALFLDGTLEVHDEAQPAACFVGGCKNAAKSLSISVFVCCGKMWLSVRKCSLKGRIYASDIAENALRNPFKLRMTRAGLINNIHPERISSERRRAYRPTGGSRPCVGGRALAIRFWFSFTASDTIANLRDRGQPLEQQHSILDASQTE